MDLVSQLVEVYLNEEAWHTKKLSREEATFYFKRLIELGNIITVSDGDLLVGYVEVWRLSERQLERVLAGEAFAAASEPCQTGSHAYVANIFVRRGYRNGRAFKLLYKRFMEVHGEAESFVGHQPQKTTSLANFTRRKVTHG